MLWCEVLQVVCSSTGKVDLMSDVPLLVDAVDRVSTAPACSIVSFK